MLCANSTIRTALNASLNGTKNGDIDGTCKEGFTALFTKLPSSQFLLFHDFPGTIPSFYHSNPEAINGGMASGGGSNWQLFWEQPVTKEPAAL